MSYVILYDYNYALLNAKVPKMPTGENNSEGTTDGTLWVQS